MLPVAPKKFEISGIDGQLPYDSSANRLFREDLRTIGDEGNDLRSQKDGATTIRMAVAAL